MPESGWNGSIDIKVSFKEAIYYGSGNEYK